MASSMFPQCFAWKLLGLLLYLDPSTPWTEPVLHSVADEGQPGITMHGPQSSGSSVHCGTVCDSVRSRQPLGERPKPWSVGPDPVFVALAQVKSEPHGCSPGLSHQRLSVGRVLNCWQCRGKSEFSAVATHQISIAVVLGRSNQWRKAAVAHFGPAASSWTAYYQWLVSSIVIGYAIFIGIFPGWDVSNQHRQK